MKNILLITNNLKLSSQISNLAANNGIFISNLNNINLEDINFFLKKDNIIAIIYDLSIVDSFKDNIDVIKKIRSSFTKPIIIVSNKYNEDHEQELFDLKIDDYISSVLTAKRILKRTFHKIELYTYLINNESQKIRKETYKNFEISLKYFQVKYREKKLDLTPKEFNIFYYMVRHNNQVLSREQIFSGVWREDRNNSDIFISSRIVDMHVSHLRDKLKSLPGNEVNIKTVRGFGYILN
ncbi:response regulator transcription factor [Apilactobacillus apisilvae]|uniref:Response regulator transcription factor n=1 Tax=Apilactobacillus apisilvae TaxID=2923364 RepID=A0ABY4PJE8_9LACO|nr:response regulator transcription factor [Apilactobacillus apisilvae]UQS85581.1 response regulator transcription factor [Apilactobacillus apisilvae]